MSVQEEPFGGTDQAGVAEWMRRVEEYNEAQARYARKQYTMAKISAVCSGLMLMAVIVCIIVLVPELVSTFEQMNVVMDELEQVMANLETISTTLADADLAGMLEGVNNLVGESQDGVGAAMEKISALDIEALNGAIADLKAVVEPLAKLFGR